MNTAMMIDGETPTEAAQRAFGDDCFVPTDPTEVPPDRQPVGMLVTEDGQLIAVYRMVIE